jgi:hypothetical protein
VNRENAAAVMRALQRFGFGDIGLTVGDFLREDFVVQPGISTEPDRFGDRDIWNDVSGGVGGPGGG